jgi:hypothetical protein
MLSFVRLSVRAINCAATGRSDPFRRWAVFFGDEILVMRSCCIAAKVFRNREESLVILDGAEEPLEDASLSQMVAWLFRKALQGRGLEGSRRFLFNPL